MAHSPWWHAEGCIWHSVQEYQLVWGATLPQAFTSSFILLRCQQLTLLCATQLHRWALKFNRGYLIFFFLYVFFHGCIRKSRRTDLSSPFPQLLQSLLQSEMLESALCLLKAIPEGVCSRTCFYSPSSPPITCIEDWLAQQPTWSFWQLLPEQLLAGEL